MREGGGPPDKGIESRTRPTGCCAIGKSGIAYCRGMAPDAKLAFTDLGGGGSDGIFTPSDLSRSYYKYPYEVGARVHSDSWGSSSNDYEYMASEVDTFTWDHQVMRPTGPVPQANRFEKEYFSLKIGENLLSNGLVDVLYVLLGYASVYL